MSLLRQRIDSRKALGAFPSESFQMQMVGTRLVSIPDNQINYIQNGYNINDIVYSLIQLIMNKVQLAPWAIYRIKDETAYKQLQAMRLKQNWAAKDYDIAKSLHTKSIELDPKPGKYGDIIEQANDYESFGDLFVSGCGYKLLTGNRFVWSNTLNAGANAGLPQELWAMPPQYMSIAVTDTFPIKIVGYEAQLWRASYKPEEVLHEAYWNPNWDVNGMHLIGIPPLRAALKILNRSNSSLDSSTERAQNNGISGVLHMKAQPGQSEGEDLLQEVQALKKRLVTEWTGRGNKGKIGVSGYDMGWLPMGLTAEEMQQIESEKWDMRRLCNVFSGVPSQLLNDPENKTFNSLEEAEKALTTRCAFPLLTKGQQAFNRKFHKDWGLDRNKVLDFDQTVFTELQDDRKDLVDWAVKLAQATGVAPNTVLDWVGLEKIDDERYNKPRVTQQMGESIDDYSSNEVDNALNNGQGNDQEDI